MLIGPYIQFFICRFQVCFIGTGGRTGLGLSIAPETDGVSIGKIVLRCPMKLGTAAPGNNHLYAHQQSYYGSAFYPNNRDEAAYASSIDYELSLGYIGASSSQFISAFTSSITLSWGQQTEVEVKPPFPLKSGSNVAIRLQQVKQ